jgi:hypothetical protein
MKLSNNGYQLTHKNMLMKGIVSLFTVLSLVACISTTEFTAANDVNLMDNNLTALLIDSSSKNNTGEKKQIAYLAALAHESGDAMAAAGSPKLALAYYRIAAVGYWRDDVSANDNQLFNVIDASKVLCDTLKGDGKAPDRDCFIIQVTLSLEVLEAKYRRIAEFKQSDFDASNIATVQSLLDELGYEATDNNAKSAGFLVNFVSNATSNTAFLNKHTTMKNYIKETLFAATRQYKQSMSEVLGYYRNNNGTAEEAKMIARHPIYKTYLSQSGRTDVEKIKAMIDTWLGSD